MTKRRLISSGSPYEPLIGFSRAVRAGDTIYVSGTVAWGDDGKLVGPGNVYVQARQAIRNIEKALLEAGATLNDVVRTRIYVTDISQLEEAARAHGETFREIRPASSVVEVSGLAQPEMLVEIEAVAVLWGQRSGGDELASRPLQYLDRGVQALHCIRQRLDVVFVAGLQPQLNGEAVRLAVLFVNPAAVPVLQGILILGHPRFLLPDATHNADGRVGLGYSATAGVAYPYHERAVA